MTEQLRRQLDAYRNARNAARVSDQYAESIRKLLPVEVRDMLTGEEDALEHESFCAQVDELLAAG